MARKSSTRGGRKVVKRGAPASKRAAPRIGGRSVEPVDPEEDVDASADPSDPRDLAPADLSGLKDGKLYYRIGEVSQITGVKPYVLRYWESEFRLMAPQKSRSKQRLYRQKDIETVLAIKRLLYEERYTIAGARKRLRELGSAARTELALGSARVEPVELPPAPEAPPILVPAAPVRDAYRRIRDELMSIRSLLAAQT